MMAVVKMKLEKTVKRPAMPERDDEISGSHISGRRSNRLERT